MTLAIVQLRPRIPLASGAVPASASALRMLLPQPPGRSPRLSAVPAGESTTEARADKKAWAARHLHQGRHRSIYKRCTPSWAMSC